MGLFPRKINSMLKGELGKAGIRYATDKTDWEASMCREERKAPSDKVAGRVNVLKYNNYVIRDLVDATIDRVEIPVKMHIGAPAEAVVNVGDHVQIGDLIARPRENALGACIHASISGKITAVGDRSIIERD